MTHPLDGTQPEERERRYGDRELVRRITPTSTAGARRWRS